MTVPVAETPHKKPYRRRREDPSEPKIALKPGERVVYGLKARTNGLTGFSYTAVEYFEIEDFYPLDGLEEVPIAYVRAGVPGREYLVVFGRQRGPIDVRNDRLVVKPLDAKERKFVLEFYRKRSDAFRLKADLITFW